VFNPGFNAFLVYLKNDMLVRILAWIGVILEKYAYKVLEKPGNVFLCNYRFHGNWSE